MILRHRHRGLVALTVALMLVALVINLSPIGDPPPLLLDEPSPLAPAPSLSSSSFTLQLVQAKVGADLDLHTRNSTVLTNIASTKKSPMEVLLDAAEKEVKPEGGLGDDTDSYVQEYVPEGWVEVEKINPKGGRGGHNNKKSRPLLTSSDKYSPKFLKERAMTFPNSSELWRFLREQERRVRHVADTCPGFSTNMADIKGGAKGPPAALITARDFISDRKNKLTFCPVYKAASTSWIITILQLGGFWKYKEKVNIQSLVRKIYPKINGLSATSLAVDTTSFMVVRHPFERLLSCYRDKFERASKAYYYLRHGEQMVYKYRKFPPSFSSDQLELLEMQVRSKIKGGHPIVMPHNPYANPVGPTFQEFVYYVLDVRHDDEHWRPFHLHCASCNINYDFILRFESLNDEGKWMLQYLNRSTEVKPRWDNPSQGDLTSQVSCTYFNQLDIRLINDLYTKYYKDFILYEYSPSEYKKCAKDYHLQSQIQMLTTQPQKDIILKNR